MGRWQARGGYRAGARLERNSDPNPFGDNAECYASVEQIDLSLGN